MGISSAPHPPASPHCGLIPCPASPLTHFPPPDLPSPDSWHLEFLFLSRKNPTSYNRGWPCPAATPAHPMPWDHRRMALGCSPVFIFPQMQHPTGSSAERGWAWGPPCPSPAWGGFVLTSLLTSLGGHSYFYVGSCLIKSTHNPSRDKQSFFRTV